MESSRVENLQKKYKLSLPDKLDQLQNLAAEHGMHCNRMPPNETEFYKFLHKLAGSSGMYGYDDICDASRALMSDLENKQNAGFQEHLDRLHHLLVTVAWR